MADNNPSAPAEPVDTTPETYDDQVEGLADLLEDPVSPDPQEDEGHDAADADPEDPDAIIAEDAAEEVADDPDGSQDPAFKGGRFAADDAKFTLPNGDVISVAEAKRSYFYQRDYTEKTTEVKALKEEALAERQKVDQQAQSLSQLSEAYNWYAQHYLPKAPEPPTDPNNYVAWIDYQREKDAYDQSQNALAYFQQQTQALGQQKQQEAEARSETLIRAEIDQLRAKDPLFRDKVKAVKWFDRAAELGAKYYGFNKGEIADIVRDHRLVLALRDALRARAIAEKATTVKEDVRKPVLATGGKRADPKTKVSRERQARSERLRREGSIDAGAASLMDLDL